MTSKNEEQKTETQKPRRRWKRWTALALLLLIGPTQFLNHTGFCYAEMRYLSERELVDRWLFGEKASAMTFEEKIESAKHRPYPTGVGEIKYPDCCIVSGEPWWLDTFAKFTNKAIVGRYLYEIRSYFPIREISKNSTRYPYMNYNNAVNSCGKSTNGDSPSTDVSQEEYENALERNRIYWNQKGEL